MVPIDETMAKWVRVLRVDLGCTWSRIGELFAKVYGMVFNGGHGPSGAFLCECAASLLGEDPSAEPWN